MTITLRLAKRSTFTLLLIAWVCGIVGVLWSFLLAFASAMNTVPAMELGTMLLTLPLPLVSLLAAIILMKRIRRGSISARLRWGVVPTFLLAALGLFIGLAAFFDMT